MEEPIYITRDFIEDVLRTKFKKRIIILYNNGRGYGVINSSYADQGNLFLNIDPKADVEESVKNYYEGDKK